MVETLDYIFEVPQYCPLDMPFLPLDRHCDSQQNLVIGLQGHPFDGTIWPMAQGKKGERRGRRDEEEEDSVKRSNRFPLMGLGIENDRATEKSFRTRQNLKYGMLSVANQTIKDLPRA